MTLLEFSDSARASAFPMREPKNLIANNKDYVIEALILMQKAIPELQTKNKSEFTKQETYSYCQTSVVAKPEGTIKRVYTTITDEICDRVFYNFVTHDRMEKWMKQARRRFPDSATKDILDLDETTSYFDDQYDDSTLRSRFGRYSFHRGKIHVAPEIHSTETLNVEWDGVKRNWQEADVLDEDVYDFEVKRVCTLNVMKYYHLYTLNDKSRYDVLDYQMRDALASLAYTYELQRTGADEGIAIDYDE
jgi:hypothetical protein